MIEGSPHVPTPEEARADPFVQWLSKERDDYVFTLDQCRSRYYHSPEAHPILHHRG